MQSFTLEFQFRRKAVNAHVSAIQRLDHIQLTVWPRDARLMEKFGTQVFHKFPGKELQEAFPGESEETRQYNEALMKALSADMAARVTTPWSCTGAASKDRE